MFTTEHNYNLQTSTKNEKKEKITKENKKD